MSDSAARQGFVDFIARAEHFGLPVGTLRDVARSDYTYRQGGSTSVSPWLDTMTLNPRTSHQLRTCRLPSRVKRLVGCKLSTTKPRTRGSTSRRTLPKCECSGSRALNTTRRHPSLQGERMIRSESSRRPSLHTVGHRTAVYWQALVELTIISDTLTTKPAPDAQARILAHAKTVRATYERLMGERVFGYQTPGWWSSQQIYTKWIVSSQIKTFADTRLLENRLPDQFARTGPPKAI